MEEELARAVGRRHDRRWREALEREVRREAGAQRSRQARHVLEAAGAAAMDPGENLSGTVPRLARLGAPGREVRMTQVLDVAAVHARAS